FKQLGKTFAHVDSVNGKGPRPAAGMPTAIRSTGWGTSRGVPEPPGTAHAMVVSGEVPGLCGVLPRCRRARSRAGHARPRARKPRRSAGAPIPVRHEPLLARHEMFFTTR